MPDLIVHAAQHVLRGARMVVLHELDTGLHVLGKIARIESFDEKAACIAERLRLDQLDLGQRRRGYRDSHTTLSVKRCIR
jgi:hypothetical protein